MNMEEFRKLINKKVTEHPELKEEILDLYQLCLDEVEEGSSRENEIQLCLSSIDDLIEENK